MRLLSPRSWVLGLGLGLVIASGASAEPPAIVQQEVNYLIRYIGESGCEFERNGAWSDAKAAEVHVRAKYDFLLKWGAIDTATDFIEKAAAHSSFAGQPYEVRCGNALPMRSSPWLSKELARYRASRQ